ncbi:GlxA family transcriptional regulator [Knoellia sp. CPCC 206453]|uniref:GlxA family transcriptional regulator n=1 Tax=Knoellia pratensis TaxID=3404796 RepID=UPI003609CE49
MKIAIHAFEGISLFHLATPSLVFGEVMRLGLDETWQTRLWSEDRRVTTMDGVVLDDLAGPADVLDADLLVFPSWHDDLRPADDELRESVQLAHHRGVSLAGLCLGAFPVVDSGLLDGREAVTHWAVAAELAARRPSVSVNADAIYVDHGDILTSAGTASSIDACLHIVRTRLGADAASMVARQLVVAPHRDGGQAQYVSRPVPDTGGVGQLGATIDWALAHLDQSLSIEALSAHAGMSRRNFTRRFIEATGSSPGRWIVSRRLDESRRLLERTDMSVEHVARACGFGSAVTFRQRFSGAYRTTPSSYRHRFSTSESG